MRTEYSKIIFQISEQITGISWKPYFHLCQYMMAVFHREYCCHLVTYSYAYGTYTTLCYQIHSEPISCYWTHKSCVCSFFHVSLDADNMLPNMISCLWSLTVATMVYMVTVVTMVEAIYRGVIMQVKHDGFTLKLHDNINVSVPLPYEAVSVYGKYSLITSRIFSK